MSAYFGPPCGHQGHAPGAADLNRDGRASTSGEWRPSLFASVNRTATPESLQHVANPGPIEDAIASAVGRIQRREMQERAIHGAVHAAGTPAGRMEALLDLAQSGRITVEQARELMAAEETIAKSIPCPVCGERGCCDMTKHPGVPLDSTVPVGTCRIDEPIDPLDVEYDGVTLRDLIAWDSDARHEGWAGTRQRKRSTPAQRAAVSAHRSAELRAKVQSGEAADKARAPSVVIGVDAEDMEW